MEIKIKKMTEEKGLRGKMYAALRQVASAVGRVLGSSQDLSSAPDPKKLVCYVSHTVQLGEDNTRYCDSLHLTQVYGTTMPLYKITVDGCEIDVIGYHLDRYFVEEEGLIRSGDVVNVTRWYGSLRGRQYRLAEEVENGGKEIPFEGLVQELFDKMDKARSLNKRGAVPVPPELAEQLCLLTKE